MKIYRIETGGESEWIVANTAIEALKVYKETTGNGLDYFDNDDDIFEVPESKWDKLKVNFPDEDDEDEKWKTYRQMVEGVVKPYYGWSTVY